MINGESLLRRPLRWAQIGGGRGSQVGYIHRSAALRDRTFELVAGAFDVDPDRGRDFGLGLGVAGDRCYSDYEALIAGEARRVDGVEVVSVATPNHTHFVIAKACLEAGLHVVCEKPLCFTAAEADQLVVLAKQKNRLLGVTYGYSGYQMIQEARALVARGELGDIRIVTMQFAHGFHSTPVEQSNPSTKWRVSPQFAGPTYVLGDLATHPLFLSETIVPQLKLKRLLCSRQSFVTSRAPLEDNAFVLMEYEGGAVGSLWTSAVNAGSTHSQRVRVVGSRASVEWWDEHPNQLKFEVQGEPPRLLDRGMEYLVEDALAEDRIGAGHPEGLFEAWSNLYRRFALAADAHDRGDAQFLETFWYPDAKAGATGVRWVEKCAESADKGAVWVDF